MKEEPSRLPAEIAAVAKRVDALVSELRTALDALRSKAGGNQALLTHVIEGKLALSGLSSEAATLKMLCRVCQHPQIKQMDTATETAARPEPVMTAQERRQRELFIASLHTVGDHTLDKDEEVPRNG